MKRANSEALDNLLGDKIQLLDHGYIIPVDYMGNENSIVESARVSYGEGTKSVNSDVALLRYLIRHKHTSPLEMAEIKFEIKLPIFVMRQLVRHRTANLSEYSGRYSLMIDEFYIPDSDHIAPQSKNNKQGREAEGYEEDEIETFRDLMSESCLSAFDTYMDMVGDKQELPLARELGRIILPLNTYTKCVWKMDVKNLMHFLALRMDAHAQYEIRVYADAIYDVFKQWMPNLAQAFVDYSLEAVTLSRMEMAVLKSLLLDKEELGVRMMYHIPAASSMSAREVREFLEKL